ncbi:hypothetical protein [Hydrotalea flava]|uniref:hypothetical protein n=1 Tax=Hydrotalea flava TaxID=714549 RepID=UPI0008346AC8|nr:hypothetical protein [Hydrotalea flava]
MKNLLILIITISKLFTSCGNPEIKITIKNKSNESIKQLIFYVQGNEYKVDKIEAKKYSTISINKNNLTLNSHDFRIESTVILKSGKINRGFYYSDLSSRPNSEYTIEVYDSISVIK